MQLNAVRGAGGLKVPQCGAGAKLRSESGDESPEAEAFCTFAHNILHFLPYGRFFRRSSGVVMCGFQAHPGINGCKLQINHSYTVTGVTGGL